MAQDDAALTRIGVKLLARSGASMKACISQVSSSNEAQHETQQSKLLALVPVLKELIRSGPPKTAKFAVRSVTVGLDFLGTKAA